MVNFFGTIATIRRLLSMPLAKHLPIVVERLRVATASLTSQRDLRIAEDYIRELEAIAQEQEAADSTTSVAGLDPHFMLPQTRSRASVSVEDGGLIGTARAHGTECPAFAHKDDHLTRGHKKRTP
jgi:hypothetical protein